MDVFKKDKRSWIMSRIKGADTAPERLVRSLVHMMGYRFRLHRKDLPGSPDIVLPRHHKIIFVHGCFWHGHKPCKRGALPESNKEFWISKISKNKERDQRTAKQLKKMGWQVLVIWQCQTKNIEKLKGNIIDFMK
ncbi:MAG: very short patch repair endonuclease [Thermodesulfovibrionales bacterium]